LGFPNESGILKKRPDVVVVTEIVAGLSDEQFANFPIIGYYIVYQHVV
jgi:hypothetical protein